MNDFKRPNVMLSYKKTPVIMLLLENLMTYTQKLYLGFAIVFYDNSLAQLEVFNVDRIYAFTLLVKYVVETSQEFYFLNSINIQFVSNICH